MMEFQSNHQTLGFEIGSTKVEPPSFLTALNSKKYILQKAHRLRMGFFVSRACARLSAPPVIEHHAQPLA
jgi:hypothetical protein